MVSVETLEKLEAGPEATLSGGAEERLPPESTAAPAVLTASTAWKETSTGRLFPHFVCRMGGLPMECLEALRAEESVARLESVLALEQELARMAQRLVPCLFQAVSRAAPAERSSLLAVKRNLHNLRVLSPARMARAGRTLEAEERTALQRYQDLARRHGEALGSLEPLLEEELSRLRGRFQTLAGDPVFRQGLVLASRVLAAEAERYLSADPARLGAKERQVERSLMRYFARTVSKTTPFSTFCSLGLGTWVTAPAAQAGSCPSASAPRPDWLIQGRPSAGRTAVRLNKAILARLRPALLRHEEIRPHLPLEWNPTLEEKADRWVFLAVVDGAEAFQRLTSSPVLLALRRSLPPEGHESLATLAERLTALPNVEASPAQARDYLVGLVEVGLLRFRLGLPDQAVDWHRRLECFLRQIPVAAAQQAADGLEALELCRQGFEAAEAAERLGWLTQGEKALALLNVALGVEPEQAEGLGLWYEDRGAEAAMLLARRPLRAATDALMDYLRVVAKVSAPRVDQANLRAFFERRFGDRDSGVPLLEFYEAFYREHFKDFLNRQQTATAEARTDSPAGLPAASPADAPADGPGLSDPSDLENPLAVPLVAAVREGIRGLRRTVQCLWRLDPGASSLDLRRRHLEGALAGVPSPGKRGAGRSVQVFAQLLPDLAGRGAGLVVDGCHTGFGKYFSRFLHVLPQELERALTRQPEVWGPVRVAELGGDAAFNANLHPRILPWTLSYPTCEGGQEGPAMAVTELRVAPCPEDPDGLLLLHGESGERVLPVDLGFLNPNLRPPLFQLLAWLSPGAAFHFPLPEEPWDTPSERDLADEAGSLEAAAPQAPPEADSCAGEEAIQYRPRIVYEDRLVLARRRWRIPCSRLPLAAASEGEAAYFLRLQRWCRGLGLPRQLFFRLRPGSAKGAGEGAGAASGIASAASRRHLEKPQYLDVDGPLTVELFRRTVAALAAATTPFEVILEEALPAPAEALPSASGRHATELILQVDFSPEPAPAAGPPIRPELFGIVPPAAEGLPELFQPTQQLGRTRDEEAHSEPG